MNYCDEELFFKVKTKDNEYIYVKIYESSNPPADPRNPGCISIDLYDEDLCEIDSGEMDYKWEDDTLQDLIEDCLDFMDIDADKIYKIGNFLEEEESYIYNSR